MNFSQPLSARALLLGALLCAGGAQAHVTLEYQVAHAGTGYKATFKVGHGCGASATRQVVVDIPVGVGAPHPMPKPGWQLAIDPAASNAGVARVTWTARTREDALPSAHYDEFVLVARMPAQAGTLYWPVRQVCDEGRNDWIEIPSAGQKLSDLKSPAAVLEVLPASGGGHAH
ncbi:MAG TPA: YcnI family protein [Ramlibacter sp.]